MRPALRALIVRESYLAGYSFWPIGIVDLCAISFVAHAR